MTLVTSRFNGHRVADSRAILRDVFGYAPMNDASRGVDIERTENGYRVELAVPGFAPGDIAISLEQNVLTIQAEKTKHRVHRTLVIPDDIDPDTIAATVEHGLLTLTMSTHAKAQPRRITVTGGMQTVGDASAIVEESE